MSEEPKESKKKPMTDEERAEMCKKMDQELDAFIDGLEKKRYTEGWPEDRWEEEMNKHPFFMKNSPGENGEMSPLVEGLAQLKFDATDNTPCELATSYKDDGNFNFSHKNYRLAILGYTEGIRLRCSDPNINATLYNNRAQCHWNLKNFRSALYDSEKALSFDPRRIKSRLRAAKAAFECSNFEACLDHCRHIMARGRNQEIFDLYVAAKRKQITIERDRRKIERKLAQRSGEKAAVVKAIIERGIRIMDCDDDDDVDLDILEPSMPGAHDDMVRLEDGVLKWPVLFLYPEFHLTDFVKACSEDIPLLIQMQQMFPPPWDRKKQYTCQKINIYHEGYDRLPHLANPALKLGDLMKTKYFELKGGTPAFCVVPRGSIIEKQFLQTYVR